MDEIRTFWDADAPTYNNSRGHSAQSPAGLRHGRLRLPGCFRPPRAGYSTQAPEPGSLSLIAARLGHQVTALDLSPKMLEDLRSARERGTQDRGSSSDPPTNLQRVSMP